MQTDKIKNRWPTQRTEEKQESEPMPKPLPSSNSPRPQLLSYHEIPEWYQDNEHIQTGYRPISASVRKSLQSLTYMHNESINIYSHLLPAILCIASEFLTYSYFGAKYPRATREDRIVFALQLFTAFICMSLSASYHTLMNHSANYSEAWSKIDYVGIIVLILGDFISGIYVGFYCEPRLQKIYWTMIITLAFVTALIVLNPSLQSRRYRLLRLGTFTVTGLSAFAPILHAIRIFPAEQLYKQSGLAYYYAEGAIVLLAVAVYAMRLPESLRPGKHDTWGASHQIFHILVVLATVLHVIGLMSAFDYNHNYRRCGSGHIVRA